MCSRHVFKVGSPRGQKFWADVHRGVYPDPGGPERMTILTSRIPEQTRGHAKYELTLSITVFVQNMFAQQVSCSASRIAVCSVTEQPHTKPCTLGDN